MSAATQSRSEYTGLVFIQAPNKLTKVDKVTGYPVTPASTMSDFTPRWYPMVVESLQKLYEERRPSVEDEAFRGYTRDDWNDFEHYKRSNKFEAGVGYHYNDIYVPYSTWYHRWTTDKLLQQGWRKDTFGVIDKPDKGLPLLYDKVSSTGNFVRRIPNLTNLIQTSLRTMLGEVRPQQSLLNNLYELKDFKTLPRTMDRIHVTLERLQKEIPAFSHRFKHLFTFKGKRALLSILGSASDLFLQEEFNIAPLTRDIMGVRDAIETERKRIAKLIAREGIRTRRDYSVSLRKDYPDLIEVSNSGQMQLLTDSFLSIRDTNCQRVTRYHEALFHAQIEYTYLYYEFQKQNALALALLDKLGVMFNPNIIWNAIPWSFVIDWVVDVSRFLDQYRMSNMTPVTVVHKFCWSTHVKRTIYCSKQNMSSTAYREPMRLISSCTEDAYLRSTSGLNITAALTGSGISLKEFILASALKTSRLK